MALQIENEVKISSEPCVVAWDSKLYVGTEDGSIRSFDANLAADASWKAHEVQAFALAAGAGYIYSASYGSISVWSVKGEKIAELPSSGADVGTLHVFGKDVYAGDEGGCVTIYENNTLKARYNVLEEVKDLGLSLPFLFTARDLDVTVTEIKPEESKQRFVTRHTMEGRSPLRVVGKHLLCTARSGNSLCLHDASAATTFKKMHEVKVSDMIITSLSVSGDYAWTGGWDGCVRRWKISGDQLEAAGALEVGACINGLVASSSDKVYVIAAGGRVVCVKST